MKFLTTKVMSQINHFSISRFWMLLKIELFRSRKGILITLVTTFGLLFFADLLLSTILEPNTLIYEHDGGYASAMIISGFILSSLSFNDLASAMKRQRYLMLPVSALEKFACMWLLTSIGWVLLFTCIYIAYVTLIANPIGQLIFGQIRFLDFNPLDVMPLNAMKYYFVLQGVFMVGAVHFKGYVLPKTLFTLILFAILCGLMAYFFMGGVINEGTDKCISEQNGLIDTPAYQFWLIAQWFFWWVLAPVSWLATYLGLKDTEV